MVDLFFLISACLITFKGLGRCRLLKSELFLVFYTFIYLLISRPVSFRLFAYRETLSTIQLKLKSILLARPLLKYTT